MKYIRDIRRSSLALSTHETKNQKERGDPGEINPVRNVIGRENLITYGHMNEFAHALLTDYTGSHSKFTRLPAKLIIVHPEEWLSRQFKQQGSSALSQAQAFSALTVLNSQNRLQPKHS